MNANNKSAVSATAAASYTKLKDGSWGVRCAAGVVVGQTINVVKRSGESKVETIASILWTGVARDGQPASLVTVAARTSAAPYRNTVHYGGYTRRGQPCGYPGCTGLNYCDECSE